MKVRDYMTPRNEIECVTPGTGLKEVAQKMKQADAGLIPVVDKENMETLLGVITDRDIVVRAVAEGKDLANAQVQDFYTEDCTTITPETDTSEAARIMADQQLHRLPVCEDQKLVGIVSLGDIAEVEAEKAAQALEGISEGAKAEGRIQ